jgi:hypothetical protein
LELEDDEAWRIHFAWHRHAAFLCHFRRRVKFKQFSTAQPHGFQCRDFLFSDVVGNFFRGELFVEIGAEAEPVNPSNLFWRRSKAGPIQEMEDFSLVAEWRARGYSLSQRY